MEKYESTRYGKEPFSAEIYLRNANGPLAPVLPRDAAGRQRPGDCSTRPGSRRRGGATSSGSSTTSGSPTTSGPRPRSSSTRAERWADYWFSDPENEEKRKKYFHDLDQVEATERNPEALSFERERAWEARRSLDADRAS